MTTYTKTKSPSKNTATSHNHQNSKRNSGAERLYGLLSETDLLIEEEREFWLANFQDLPSGEQQELARILVDADREIARERERHQGHTAEINAKMQTRIKKFSAYKKFEIENDKSVLKGKSVKKDTVEDILDEELLSQLEEWENI